MFSRVIFGVALVAGVLFAAECRAAKDPLQSAAEYYFSHQDYKQALALWTEVQKKSPKNADVLLRIAELKLHFGGREAMRETLYDFVERYRTQISPANLEKIQKRWQELQDIFLTDQGQEKYLQAVAKLSRGDFEGALTYLNQANELEKGNLKILLAKAKCEKSTKALEAFYATMKQAYQSNPFDSQVLEDLTEAHIYFENYGDAISIYKPGHNTPESVRVSLGYAVALMETGDNAQSLKIMKKVISDQKQNTVHPIAFFVAGKLLAQRPRERGEAISYLRRFLSEANRNEKMKADGWDAYRTGDKVLVAKKLLVKLEA